MAQIGTIQDGTTVINLDFTPQYLSFGTYDDGNGGTRQPEIQSFSLSVAGREVINLNNSDFIRSFGYWLLTIPTIANDSEATPTNDLTPFVLKLANGNLPNQQTQIRITASVQGEFGPETAPVFAFSSEFGTDVVLGATNSINANANALVSDFDLLLFNGSNFVNADITFENGFTDRYDANDIRDLLCLSGQFNRQGFFYDNSGVLTLGINNLSLFTESIQSVRLYADNQILNYATFKVPKV